MDDRIMEDWLHTFNNKIKKQNRNFLEPVLNENLSKISGLNLFPIIQVLLFFSKITYFGTV